MKATNNKYYLTFVKLYQDNSQGTLYYECFYENGIIKKIIIIPFEEDLKIEVELNY